MPDRTFEAEDWRRAGSVPAGAGFTVLARTCIQDGPPEVPHRLRVQGDCHSRITSRFQSTS